MVVSQATVFHLHIQVHYARFLVSRTLNPRHYFTPTLLFFCNVGNIAVWYLRRSTFQSKLAKNNQWCLLDLCIIKLNLGRYISNTIKIIVVIFSRFVHHWFLVK